LGWSPLEYFAYRFSDHIIFVSENEVDFSERTLHMAREKAMVIPNVLTIPPLAVTEEELDRFKERYGLTKKVVATFLGDLTSVQNKDCADLIVRELAPEVRDRDEIRFLIVGKGAEAFDGAPDNVVFTGYLDKIDQVIAATDIFVAPMRVGAGTKTKVLLFMGYGIPILTTKVGIEGIDVRGRDDIQVVEIADFVDSMRAFAPRERADMAEAGNTEAARDYSPEVMHSRIEELMDRIREAKGPDRHGQT
jgi:glycosyltransferase involved in cell wall biosynthesis